MSIVFRATDRRLLRPVAVKVLPPELTHDPAVRTRFAREAHTAAQLAHPNIVPIYDLGEYEGMPYLVMGYVGGGSLASLLARDPRPPIADVRRILCEVADALDWAHVRGVIHRDIKPDNILIDRDSGRTLVTDFGIARALEAGSRLTKSGVAVGTPTYMSPEQARGDRGVDGRSDIYALGVVAYQMLTGRVPFQADNSMALLLKHVADHARPIAELRPDAPRALREIVERAMAKSPDDRWPTAGAFRDAVASDEAPGSSWRRERELVGYTTPNTDTPRSQRAARPRTPREVSPARGEQAAAPARGTAPSQRAERPVMIPEHLAVLTPEQRADIRLWHGRIHLVDRVRTARWYALGTLITAILAAGGVAAVGIDPEAFPLILGPVVPVYMGRKLWRRLASLKQAGLRRRRVLLMPRIKWILPATPVAPEKQFEKVASRQVLEGPFGPALRQAAEDGAFIIEAVRKLPKADRALLPEVTPTVNALMGRAAGLASAIERLDEVIDPQAPAQVDRRIAALLEEAEAPDRERRLVLLRRQRVAVDEMLAHRATLAHQLESACLTLGTLRLDVIRLRSSGLPSAIADVSNATQEARALSRDIGALLEAVAEARES